MNKRELTSETCQALLESPEGALSIVEAALILTVEYYEQPSIEVGSELRSYFYQLRKAIEGVLGQDREDWLVTTPVSSE